MQYKTILCIPDQHIEAGQNLRRFEALGNLIVERKFNYVVNGGDMFEAKPLYGINAKKSWTPKKETVEIIEADIEHGTKAYETVWKPWEEYNKKLRSQKKKKLKIERIFCVGNHDERIFHFVRCNREYFAERWGVEDPLNDVLNQEEFWDEIHGYQIPVEIEGILFSHNYPSGTSTASTNDTILKLASQSAVGFHSHKGSWDHTSTATGRPTPIIQCGWFADPEESNPDWVGPQGGRSWFNGIVILNGVDGHGWFEPEIISTERLIREYL